MMMLVVVFVFVCHLYDSRVTFTMVVAFFVCNGKQTAVLFVVVSRV